MTREKAIQIIEFLYPPDAQWEATATIGQQLFEQAKRECGTWRSADTAVLLRFAELCEERERMEARSR